jgi:hypothetical protein
MAELLNPGHSSLDRPKSSPIGAHRWVASVRQMGKDVPDSPSQGVVTKIRLEDFSAKSSRDVEARKTAVLNSTSRRVAAAPADHFGTAIAFEEAAWLDSWILLEPTRR